MKPVLGRSAIAAIFAAGLIVSPISAGAQTTAPSPVATTAASPASSPATTTTTTTGSTTSTTGTGNGWWGLIGLVGLLGLFGMGGRRSSTNVDTYNTTTRP